MSQLLEQAEELERDAAEDRVDYFQSVLRDHRSSAFSLLDVGCGNGHGVVRWRAQDTRAFGADVSMYRMGRWVALHGRSIPMVVADAAHLPFSSAEFDVVICSGMIEHVGVVETSCPYSVVAQPDRDATRAAVIAELARTASGLLIVDCPNGSFPIDFWHGDRLGALRFHRVPDSLLPSHAQLLSWGRSCGLQARVAPLRERLRFRQIGRRWWGRLLRPIVKALLAASDRLLDTRASWLLAWAYPYVVVCYTRERAARASGGAV